MEETYYTDIKSINRRIRIDRYREFHDLHILQLSESSDISPHPNNGFKIIPHDSTIGNMIYFPKKDRILFIKKNKWASGGLNKLYSILHINK